MWLAAAVPLNFAMMIILPPRLAIDGSSDRSRSEFDRQLAVAALEPGAVQNLLALVDHVIVAVGPELARERPVEEAPDFTFAGEELGEGVEQPIVVVAQRIALHFAGAKTGEGSGQVVDVICGGRSCDHSCSGSGQDKKL